MEWIEPVQVNTTVKYSSSLPRPDDGENDSIVLSGHLPDRNLTWFASDDLLCLHSTIHNGIKNRNFQGKQGEEFQVTCVAPISSEMLALVGLSSTSGSGAVALYNYSTSLILQSWSVSHKVTCLTALEIPNASYKQFLKSDCFLFALGTEEGHVMLLAIDQHYKLSEGTHYLDLNVVHYATTEDILHKRAFMKPPVVLVIPLNDPMYRGDRFILESMQESQTTLNVPQGDIHVTSLKYVMQNQSLCVGYNVQGAFQMFSLKTLDLDFSGFAQGFKSERLGMVLDFAFLEPEDDPRHYCYLLVVAEKAYGKRVAPCSLLYSLTYVHHDTSPEGIILYEDLQHITLRLEIDFGPLILTEDSSQSDQYIKLITCKSFSLSCASNVNNSSKPSSCQGLCYFGLYSSSVIYVAIFDLNQWYQAQMPSRWIFDDMTALCPFMGFYRGTLNHRAIPQVWIQTETCSIFHRSSVVNPAEAYYYPSALNFRLTVVSHVQSETMFFLGIQSLLLYKLAQAGSQALNQPHRFYVQASKAGLIPPEMDIVAPNVTQMAEALLNVGLDNNSRAFLVSCIKDEGANLNFVEKWAWQQVLNLKTLRESLCQILFDHSTQELEQQVHNQLYRVTHQFNNLSVLYDVMDEKIRALNSGVNDKLRDKSRAVYLLSLHLQTVLWFLHGGLLPEVEENVVECSSLPYPRLELQKFYRSRKLDIEALSSSVKSHEVLLIEQLVPTSIRDLWLQESGLADLTYPPPSLYALLSAYLRPDVDDVTKHRIVQYVFLDLTWIYSRHPHYGNILQHLVTFPSTYSLSPSLIKITQAFWHLDHQNFDDALGMLLDPLVSTMDITNAQQRAILRAFLYQEQRMHALKYATHRQPVCPELEDIQLHLTILIANSQIGDALGYLRQNRNRKNNQELMQHLLCGCREMRKLNVLFTLPLSDEEEEQLTSFLKQSQNIDLQEALLLYFIQRCQYPEAIAYSERLNKMWPARDAASRERFNCRNLLMQTLVNALPPITCKLAAIANSRPTGGVVRGKYPQPLSVSVLPATSTIQYSGSAFFRTVMEQSRATHLIEQKLHMEAQTPLRVRKRKMDSPEEPEEVHGTDSTPFLSNIVQPSKRNVPLGMSLTFVSPKQLDNSTMMSVTNLDQTSDLLEGSRQSKRPRYSLFPKPVGAKTDSEVTNVLQTPPINRSRKLATEIAENMSRPSSILKDKMRRFINFSGYPDQPAEPIVFSETQHSSEHSETEMEVTEAPDTAETPKHLRFSLPNLSPPSDVEIMQSTPDKRDDSDLAEAESSKVAPEEFLSFEDEEAAGLEPEPALEEVQKSMPESIPEVVSEITPDITPEVSQDVPVAVPPIYSNISNLDVPVTKISVPEEDDQHLPSEEAQLTDLQPVGLPSMATACMPTLVDEIHTAFEDKDESDESEIVCLDSSSDEGGVHGEEAEVAEAEEEYQEEEEVDEEQEYEDEEAEETEEEIAAPEANKSLRLHLEYEEEEGDYPVDETDDKQVEEGTEDRENSADELDEKRVEEEDGEETEDQAHSADELEEKQAEVDEEEDAEDEENPVDEMVEKEVEEDVADQVNPMVEESSNQPAEEDDDQEMETEEDMDRTAYSEQEDQEHVNYQTVSMNTRSKFAFSSSEESSSLDGRSLSDDQKEEDEAVEMVETEEPESKEEDAQSDAEDPEELGETVEGAEGEADVEEDQEDQEDEGDANKTNVGDRSIHLQMAEITPTIVHRPHTRRITEMHKFTLSLSSDEEQSSDEEESEAPDVPDLPEQTDEEEDEQEDDAEVKEADEEELEEENEGEVEEADEEEPEEAVEEDSQESEPKQTNDMNRTERIRLELSDVDVSEEDSEVIAAESQEEDAEQVENKSDEEDEEEEKPGSDQCDTEEIEADSVVGEGEVQYADCGSSTDENEDLREILNRHEVVGIPLPETVVSLASTELSTIVEERDCDQSNMTMTESVNIPHGYEDLNIMCIDRRSDSPIVEPEFIHPEPIECESEDADPVQSELPVEGSSPAPPVPVEQGEPESFEVPVEAEVDDLEPPSDSRINTLDAPIVDEDVFELESGSGEQQADMSMAEEEMGDPQQKTRGRSRSLRLSRVALPFSSRRSIYDKRDGSPDSVTSEPPPSIADLMIGADTKTTRRRRHSASQATSAPLPTRRSSRLNTTSAVDSSDNVPPAVAALRDQPPVPQTPPRTPLRTGRKRTSSRSSIVGDDEFAAPPSLEVSPTGSSFSGSFCGTPVRRSARIAQKEQTPEPTTFGDAVVGSGRMRRHSTSTYDTGATNSPLPSRRSGRKSSLSRDVSPESIASEPAIPTTADVTPSRRKSSRNLKSSQKSCTLNLFPVLEESETTEGSLTSSRAASTKTTRLSSKKTEPIEKEEEKEAQAPEEIEEQKTPPKPESPNPSEGEVEEPTNSKRSTRSRQSNPTSSSPGPSRYNLRRGRRNSELDAISEEDGAAAAVPVAVPTGTSESLKRGREEGTTAEESTESDQPGAESETKATRRATRTKRKKGEEEMAKEETEETLGFVRRPRQPRNLPKRDPQIKSRPSGPRRSMKLE